MSTPADRGWGDPFAPGFEDNIIPINIGPFPRKGKVTKLHPVIKLRGHKSVAYLFTMAMIEVITTTGYRFDGAADDWGFNRRPIRGYETKWKLTHLFKFLSLHSWGIAFDLNALTNPMTSDGIVHTDMPGAVIAIFEKWGFTWGGRYNGKRKDPMHMEWGGTKAQAEQRERDVRAYLHDPVAA